MSGRTISRYCNGQPSRLLGMVFALAMLLAADLAAGPINTGSTIPRSAAETMDRLAAPLDAAPSGIYALEQSFTFNTLDAVAYDAKSGRLSLAGHFDRRFIGPRIPYLQHLAALLEIKDEPHFSLETEPASLQAIKAKLATTAFSRDRILAHFDKVFDQDGSITWLGRSILSSLGLSPIQGHRAPGFLGAEVEPLAAGGGVRVRRLLAGSPANQADLKAGDEITRFNGKTPASAQEFERLVRFAGNGNTVAIAYKRGGRSAEASVALLPDPDADPWTGLRQGDVDALLPAASQGRPTVDRLRDYARSLEAGFQIPPDLVQLVLGVRPLSAPQYFGEASNSQLARLMFEADYSVIKPLGHRVDLKERVPGYQTWFDYANLHPQARAGLGGKRIWVSVAKVTAVQSPSGETIAFRDVKMRFNIRNQLADGRDGPTAPEVAAYADLLTKSYDSFAEDYFALHELSEVAKLAEAANWMRQKTPGLRLPTEGRVAWNGPPKVPGMVYLQVPHTASGDVWLVPHGGVNANPCLEGTRICVIPFDRGTTDPFRSWNPPLDAGSSAIGTALGAPQSEPPAAGATGTVDFDGRSRDSVTLDMGKIKQPMDVLGDGVKARAVPKAAVDQEDQRLRDQIAKPADTAQDKARKAGSMLQLAWSLHERGKDDEAIKLVKDARALAPNHPMPLLMLAATQDQAGNRRGAIESLKQYVSLDPGNDAAKRMLARLQGEEHDGIVRPSTWPRLQPVQDFGAPLGLPNTALSGNPSGQPGAGQAVPGQSGPGRTAGGPQTAPQPQPGGPTTVPPVAQGGTPPSGQPPVSSTAPITSAGQPRSPAAVNQMTVTAQMTGKSEERGRAIEVDSAIAKAGDPCNFDQRRGGGACAMPDIKMPTPRSVPVKRPEAQTWKDRKAELDEARVGWQRRLNELRAKPEESWTPEDKKDFADLPKIEAKLDKEEQKVDKQLDQGNESGTPEPLPQPEPEKKEQPDTVMDEQTP